MSRRVDVEELATAVAEKLGQGETGEAARLRKEVLDLQVEIAMLEEKKARELREITHKVGLEKERSRQERELGVREAELGVREKNLGEEQKRFEERVGWLRGELKEFKTLMGQVLKAKGLK